MASPRRILPELGVVLVEPIAIVRASLRMLFAAEPDVDLVGEAETPDEAMELVGSIQINPRVVALVGLEFSGEHDSFWLIRSIRELAPRLVILATGTDLNPTAISHGLFVGADGFVHKNSSPDRFVEATRRAAAGELVLEGLPRGALGKLVDHAEGRQASILTDRERSVLVLAAEGLTARQMGRRLGVCERTISTHLNHIYRKLDANGRVAAIEAARRSGALPESESFERQLTAT